MPVLGLLLLLMQQLLVRIEFAGDFALGRRLGPAIAASPGGGREFFRPLRQHLRDVDFALANLEGAIREDASGRSSGEVLPVPRYDLSFDGKFAGLLTESGFHGFGLANNHSLDAGFPGLKTTIARLRDLGRMPVLGQTPLTVKTLPLTILAVDLTAKPRWKGHCSKLPDGVHGKTRARPKASPDGMSSAPGWKGRGGDLQNGRCSVASIHESTRESEKRSTKELAVGESGQSHDWAFDVTRKEERERLLDMVRRHAAVRPGRLLFLYFHGGEEDSPRILPGERRFFEDLLDAGAAGIFGHHAHRLKPGWFRRGKPIFPGLGSVLFDRRRAPDCFGLLIRGTFWAGIPLFWESFPLHLRPANFQPVIWQKGTAMFGEF